MKCNRAKCGNDLFQKLLVINEKENKDVQKVSVGKVSESVIQGIKVSGNVEK